MDIAANVMGYISLDGKVAMITGGAAGIGLGTARVLAQAGAAIALLDTDEAGGRDAAEEIEKLGGKSKFYRCDVTSSADCGRTTGDVVRDFGRIDILFNNAGIAVRRNTLDLSEDDWDRAIDVNLKGIYLLSRHVIPHMIRSGGGSIINTGSGWSLRGGPDAVSYCASKGGVLNMTRAMAIDHGKDNIRVNCVCPGDVDTALLRGEAAQLGADENEFMREAADRPLARVGTPEDVAKAVLFFAGDMSGWVTGSFLAVDGGGLA